MTFVMGLRPITIAYYLGALHLNNATYQGALLLDKGLVLQRIALQYSLIMQRGALHNARYFYINLLVLRPLRGAQAAASVAADSDSFAPAARSAAVYCNTLCCCAA